MLADTVVTSATPSTVVTTCPVPLSVTVTLLLPAEITGVTAVTSASTYALVATSWAAVGSPAPVILLVPIAMAPDIVPPANASTFAANATVPVVDGSVIVTSAVEAGPISVALFVPLSLSSKNSKKPALVAPFLSCTPAFAIGVVNTGVVSVLFVNVWVAAVVTIANPPAVLPSWTRSVSNVVSTDISPSVPVNELF